MKQRALIAAVFLTIGWSGYATRQVVHPDSVIINKMEVIDPDAMLQQYLWDALHATTVKEQQESDTLLTDQRGSTIRKYNGSFQFSIPKYLEPIHVDSLLLSANPLFIDLVYMGLPLKFEWNLSNDFHSLNPVKQSNNWIKGILLPVIPKTTEQIISDLRHEALCEITRKSTHLYRLRYDQLPDPNGTKSHIIEGKPIRDVRFVDDDKLNARNNGRLVVQKARISPWKHRASVLAQFTQNSVSTNWHQGGSDNVAILGILSGQLNYDNKKSIQWDNNAEWRMGFNSVEGGLRWLNTNDDVVKANSKLGIKAGGNWFYSGSVDFSTQLFDSYKGVQSTDIKTAFLTPVRLNIGMGLDYKYKKIFSLLLSPVSYKYIYVKDPVRVNPNSFGVKTGENVLSEVGSSFRAVVSYPLTPELQIDSKLWFYTNYQKVEIDWEIVGNYTINRFMSTRLSFNPRYDNTVIMAASEKAELQYKQLLSVGFSHRFK